MRQRAHIQRFTFPGAPRALAVVLICALLGSAAFGPVVPRVDAAETAVDTRLPSLAAGTGGKLAIRVSKPAAPRYGDGAPVIVIVPVGQTPGVLANTIPLTARGFVAVTFLFPGGVDSSFHSDGAYDFRGPMCQLALRDVLLFASGSLADSAGRFVSDVAETHLTTDNVGVVGISNGGSLVAVTLSVYASSLPGVRYMISWESPTGPQTINGDLGSRRYDCDLRVDGDGNGIQTDDAKNAAYTAYGPVTCLFDDTRLAWDPDYPMRYSDPTELHPTVVVPGTFFMDGNANGHYDYLPGPIPQCADLNGNNMLDPSEDYILTGAVAYGPVVPSDSLMAFWSPNIVQAAWDRGLCGPSWPAHVPTPEQATAYWNARDAAPRFEALAASRPDFRGMLLYQKGDHVQTMDDHVHIRQAYDGFTTHGLWCRLNPDRAYFAAVTEPPADYVETAAGLAVSGSEMKAHGEPVGLNNDFHILAGAMEMADRVHCDHWTSDLVAPLALDCAATSAVPPGEDDQGGARVSAPRFAVHALGPMRPDGTIRFRLDGVTPGDVVRLAMVSVRGRSLRTMTIQTQAGAGGELWQLGGATAQKIECGVYFIVAHREDGSMATDRLVVRP